MKEKYLDMQRNFYNSDAKKWSLNNKDPVVGSYDLHNSWNDYNLYLFKNFDTSNLIALEYGCGPGRNIVRFANQFKRIDGVDISEECIEKAKLNLKFNNIQEYNLKANDGNNIPFDSDSYDVVFSVICLQHICCHQIRFDIMKEVYRVLKKEGKFCFQMGLGGRHNAVNYYDNDYDATVTNSGRDVSIENEVFLKNDLLNIGFKNYKSDIRETGPGDNHKNWIWVQVEK